MVTNADVEAALAITPKLYSAALDFDLWPPVLGEIARQFDAVAAQVVFAEFDGLKIIASNQYGADDELIARWLTIEDHFEADPRARRMLHLPNQPFVERLLMPVEEWHASRIYRDVFEPCGLDSTLAVQTTVEDVGLMANFGMVRRREDPPFDRADIEKFHLYLPHFREAGRVVARLHTARRNNGLFAQLFDLLKIATIVTDRFGQVEYRNAAAVRLLRDCDGLTMSCGRIAASDTAATSRLRDAILKTALEGGAGSDSTSTAIALPRDGGRPSLLATVSRVDTKLQSKSVLGGELLSVVFVSDPAQRYETDAEALQRLFGLTAAEAKVMALVAEGSSARSASEALGRSYETVRSQLKSIYGKTGSRNQADLVRLAAGLAGP